MNLTWLPRYKVGDRSGSTSRTRRLLLLTNLVLPPFDANKSLTKLTSWDSPPTEAEVEDIKPLLTRIQSLKSATRSGLIGTQLMAFFLQRRIQPLQARVSKLWSYSGSKDLSRVSKQDPEKKDLDKRVRFLTTLTKEKEIPALTADFFDSMMSTHASVLVDSVGPPSAEVCRAAASFP
jgi:hypothetical protein